jgi:hypothetical protein
VEDEQRYRKAGGEYDRDGSPSVLSGVAMSKRTCYESIESLRTAMAATKAEAEVEMVGDGFIAQLEHWDEEAGRAQARILCCATDSREATITWTP